MSGPETRGMKMAKACQEDLAAACELFQFLKAVSDDWTGAEVVDEFGYKGYATCATDIDFIRRAFEKGGLSRVIWGLQTLLDPKNEVVDPSLPHLELHPRFASAIDLVAHLTRQSEWSSKTFGPGVRTKGVVDHIRKELAEIEAAPSDLAEWIDVAILAFDGAWRTGATPRQIAEALVAKQAKNESRTWPDWRTADPDKAIEHVRTGGAS